MFDETRSAVQRHKVDRAIDDMVQAVEAARPQLVQLANVDGARLRTAAALFMRALDFSLRRASLTSGRARVQQ